jgi:hypothetical protein
MNRRLLAAVTACLAALTCVASAGAATLGITAVPAGWQGLPCPSSSQVVAQLESDPSTPFTVPAGGGFITQWQTLTKFDSPGRPLTLVVVRFGTSTASVVATDTVVLPTPLPASGVASFTLADPIQVQAGDSLGLASQSASSATCALIGTGTMPSTDVAALLVPPSPPALFAGETLHGAGIGQAVVDVAATLTTTEDAGVSASVFPSSLAAGGSAVLSSTVSNAGPLAQPITFVDQVPSGLQIQSATAGGGPCAVVGQTVTCTITGLPVGQSVPVEVAVTAPAAGTYTNRVSVSPDSGLSDPTLANNSASATLSVGPAPVTPAAPAATLTAQVTTQACVVPGLRNTPVAVARTVLSELGCQVRVAHVHSSLRRGLVIGTRGKAGSYPHEQLITLLVSSGKKPKAKHHRRKHR